MNKESLFKKFHSLREMLIPPTYIIKEGQKEGVSGYIASYTDRTSYISEQFKILRTNLYSLSAERPLKTFAIVSSQLQEGKSIISSNIAVTLSLDKEKKVLLLDADFRKPRIHSLFGLPQKPGLSDFIKGITTLEQLLTKPAIGDLYILPSGTPISDPSEILGSAKLKLLLGQLKTEFDYIILDTPPVINVTDASIIASLCDAVLLVVKAGLTPKNIIEEAFNLLKEANAKPIACILNDAYTPIHSFAKYKYYYRDYGKLK